MKRILLALPFLLLAACDNSGPTAPSLSHAPDGAPAISSTRLVSPFEPGSTFGLRSDLAFDFSALVSTATTSCTFTIGGTTWKLNADCTTDGTIFIPNGFTLDGRNHLITAVDPAGGHFVGGIVQNAGTVANVKYLRLTASGLSNACDVGAARLRGILFDGASGTIDHNTITGVNQGASGCQEGNSIEVRNCDNPGTKTVNINHNIIRDFQKTGIVTNCDVNATIDNNDVGASATQEWLAANGIQVGFGAKAKVTNNAVAGNSWCCVDAAATAILVIDAANGVEVSNNKVRGNADVGIYFDELSDGGKIQNNTVFEPTGTDGYYDVGIGDYGVGNNNRNNDVCGYDTPYDGNLGVGNKVCGQKVN